LRLAYPDPEQNKILAGLVQERLGGGLSDCQCLAGLDDDEIVAVVCFFNYRWPNIEVGFFSDSPRWALNRALVAEALSYPFVQLNCQRITALVEKRNKPARKMVQRLGFIEEGKLRKASPNGDMFIYGLLPGDFRLKQWKNS